VAGEAPVPFHTGGADTGLGKHASDDILREYKHLMGTARYRTSGVTA
jgi:hypothetical protein